MDNTGQGNVEAERNGNTGMERAAPEMEIEVQGAEVVQDGADKEHKQHS